MLNSNMYGLNTNQGRPSSRGNSSLGNFNLDLNSLRNSRSKQSDLNDILNSIKSSSGFRSTKNNR